MTRTPKNILIIRFSAMGDVVLTVPVILSLLEKYPDTQITLLTKSFFHPFFQGIPNLTLYPVDLKRKHKGVKGLYRLVNELTAQNKYDMLIDLHSVMRSWVLTTFFRLKNIPVYRIDKGRKEKKAFVKQKNRKQLPHTTQRYHAVFKRAGLEFSLQKGYLKIPALSTNFHKKHTVLIGIAPFAAHKSKQWGMDKIEFLINLINKRYSVTFYLFGGGANEVMRLEKLAAKFDNVLNIAGKYSLNEELQWLKSLKVLLAMDSGNMHIASLLDIPVISVWGGTHPDLGFRALYQPTQNSIQIAPEKLSCRPCSVYGTDACSNKDAPFACMQRIEPDLVFKRMEALGVFVG